MGTILFYLSLILIIIIAISFIALFYQTNKMNKILSVVGLFIIIVIFTIKEAPLTVGVIYAFVVAGTFLAGLKGGFLALFLITGFSEFIYSLDLISSIDLLYLSFIIITGGIIAKISETEISTNKRLICNLTAQIKEMRALREISALLQGTMDLETVLHIILSAVTAGYGLQFNRAILFLKDKNRLQGKLGIGPLSKESGLLVWQRVAAHKTDLDDMIKMKEDVNLDQKLNTIIEKLSFSLENDNLAVQVLKEEEPVNIKEPDLDDPFQLDLKEKLNVKAFALLPLIVKEEVIGLLFVDNIVNETEITHKDIDSLLPFANQAALAIENAKLYKLKEEMAIKDNLTNLYNQRYFQQSLDQAVIDANETESSFALLMIDIDYFKVYNDNNGHPAGNEALINLAHILVENVRDEDIVCRFGGEEFSIILPNVDSQLAMMIAQRIKKKVAAYQFKYQDLQPDNNLTVSTGLAIFPTDGETGRELLNQADKALYKAKETGRNKVVSADEKGADL